MYNSIINLIDIYTKNELDLFYKKLIITIQKKYLKEITVICINKMFYFNWEIINNNPYKFAKNATKNKLENCIDQARKNYYSNAKKILGDDQYDILEDYLKNNFQSIKISEVGFKVSKESVKLPTFLPSMGKIKANSDSLNKWTKKFKGPYILSDKLDGMSLLIDARNYPNIQAYTRGDGNNGKLINWILEYINIGKLKNDMVRGELIVSKKNWEIIQNINSKYSNARNFVSGYTNRKSISPDIIKYIDFIAYEYITEKPLNIENQLNILNKLKLNVVNYISYNNISNTIASNYLQNRRLNGNFEIDGVIISDNSRPYLRSQTKYPDYSKAFKMILDEQTAEVLVLNIIWCPSMHGLLNPVVQISPVILENVKMTKLRAVVHSVPRKSRLCIGARSWHVAPRSCTEGERPPAGALCFHKTWTDRNQRGTARTRGRLACYAFSRETASEVALIAHVPRESRLCVGGRSLKPA